MYKENTGDSGFKRIIFSVFPDTVFNIKPFLKEKKPENFWEELYRSIYI